MELWMWAAFGAIVAAIAATLVIFTMRWRDLVSAAKSRATVSEANTSTSSPQRVAVVARSRSKTGSRPTQGGITTHSGHRPERSTPKRGGSCSSIRRLARPGRTRSRASRGHSHGRAGLRVHRRRGAGGCALRGNARPRRRLSGRPSRIPKDAEGGDATTDQLLGAFLIYRELLEFLLDPPQREETVFDAEPPPATTLPSSWVDTTARRSQDVAYRAAAARVAACGATTTMELPVGADVHPGVHTRVVSRDAGSGPDVKVEWWQDGSSSHSTTARHRTRRRALYTISSTKRTSRCSA